MIGRVVVRSPVRVLDAGGWTDTWFAGGGVVCNLAVSDGVEVTVEVTSPGRSGHPVIDLGIRSFGERYDFPLHSPPGRHRLVERTLQRGCPPDTSLKVTVASSVPPACGLGTSASVVVGLLAALGAVAGEPVDAPALAAEAHRVETEDLGLQSGVQDQCAAAHGGANLVVVESYPKAEVRALALGSATWEALSRRLVTVYLGVPHRSSRLHEGVIARLGGADGAALLAPMRAAARRAAAALVAGDIDAYGEAMTDNTEAQARLHPELVGTRARAVAEVATSLGAVGWKVNGAGGDGGSVTVVCPDDPGPVRAGLEAMPGVTYLPLEPARRGARVVEAD